MPVDLGDDVELAESAATETWRSHSGSTDQVRAVAVVEQAGS